MFHINSCQGEAPGPLEKGPAGRDSMARPQLDDEERRALGQRVRMAAELRLGEGRLDKPPPGRMPALLTARSPDSPRSYRPALVQSLG